MIDTIQVVHISITTITTLSTIVLGWITFFKDKGKEERLCEIERQALHTKVSVLEERLDNEIHLLEKLDDKLDRVINEQTR